MRIIAAILFLSIVLLACGKNSDDSDTADVTDESSNEIVVDDESADDTSSDNDAADESDDDTIEESESNVDTTESFALTSSAMEEGGDLPIYYTCDGQSISPPLTWSGAPEGTVGYAIAMHHVPGPGDTHWYWVIYNIPAEITALTEGETDVGTFGTNSVNDLNQYAPPCSQGPGTKEYTITVYALSAAPDLPDPTVVDRDTLLAAISEITLGSAEINVSYTRN